jgi:predicted SAM-dependent methyltransferase
MMEAKMTQLLNLGCGSRFHPAWTNVDFVTRNETVRTHNLLHGIPFPDGTFDGVYHSHILEHFSRRDAVPFIMECHRVLRPGGILRIVVPDLERLAREYLRTLEGAENGDTSECLNYDWIMIHLYDQVVRENSGGTMAEWLSRNPVPNQEYALKWVGVEGKKIVAQAQCRHNKSQAKKDPHWKRAIRKVVRVLTDPGCLREPMIKKLLNNEYQLLQLGRFRRSGEVHQWMYDRHSLSRIVIDAGFVNPSIKSATNSAIPDWPHYNLDTEPNGEVFHPDSIFLEATKP